MTPNTYKSAMRSLFSFEGYKLCGILEGNDRIEVSFQKTRSTGTCPCCDKKHQHVIEEFFRTIRDLDIVGRQCYIRLVVYRISCSCGFCGMEQLNFLDKHSRFTNRFVEYVALLCQKMCLSDVAEIMKINWKTAKSIDKAKLRELVVDLEAVNPKRIGVDEIAYAKGHKYLTVVRDVDLGKIIWVGTSRKKETLDGFFKRLGIEKSWDITVAVIDMWEPYIASIKANTNAAIVFDKFHIAKVITEAVDSVRKKEFAKADKEERLRMKKKRFLILSRQKRLDNKKRETLFDLLDINKNLYSAYLLKEQALDIFDEPNEQIALKRLKRWLENIEKAGIEQFQKAAKRIKKYMFGIINYFKHQITNAQSEGFNNKINVIKRRAYGFKDLEYFKLKILQSCG